MCMIFKEIRLVAFNGVYPSNIRGADGLIFCEVGPAPGDQTKRILIRRFAIPIQATGHEWFILLKELEIARNKPPLYKEDFDLL